MPGFVVSRSSDSHDKARLVLGFVHLNDTKTNEQAVDDAGL